MAQLQTMTIAFYVPFCFLHKLTFCSSAAWNQTRFEFKPDSWFCISAFLLNTHKIRCRSVITYVLNTVEKYILESRLMVFQVSRPLDFMSMTRCVDDHQAVGTMEHSVQFWKLRKKSLLANNLPQPTFIGAKNVCSENQISPLNNLTVIPAFSV